MKSTVFGDICYACGWSSIVLSVTTWFAVDEFAAIFFGLWSPTFFILSVRDLVIANQAKEDK